MTPTEFKECNTTFNKPSDMTDEQCGSIRGYRGIVEGGNLDGCPVIVTAWKPNEEELKALNEGAAVYLCFLTSILVPHYVCTNFKQAVSL